MYIARGLSVRWCHNLARRVWALLIAGLLWTLPLDNGGRAAAQNSSVGPADVSSGTPDKPISFRDRLIVGLKAMSKSDIAFVDSVVAKVQAGQLPQRLVDQTFFWARDRASRPVGGRPHRPVIYFRPALTLQAKKLGVTL
jgi:hypothetical protein